MEDEARAVLDFWFRELTPEDWFQGCERVDAMVRERFADTLARAMAGDLDEWVDDTYARLALIIVIDQFSRNLHRDDPRAYAGDAKAQALVVEGLDKGADMALTLSERQFFYMPLMHAEDKALQARSVACFARLVADAEYVLDFAKGHRNVVERFGRFPMRNAALGRETSAAEQAYLDAGGGYPVDDERLG